MYFTFNFILSIFLKVLSHRNHVTFKRILNRYAEVLYLIMPLRSIMPPPIFSYFKMSSYFILLKNNDKVFKTRTPRLVFILDIIFLLAVLPHLHSDFQEPEVLWHFKLFQKGKQFPLQFAIGRIF